MARCCRICQDEGQKNLFVAHIYTREGKSYELHLCREHDIEFFKMGQIRFMIKYGIKNPNEEESGEDGASKAA